MCDDGLVIDLSRMKDIRVDPKRARPCWSAAARSWGDVDHATHAFGLAVPAGIISTTGVGGLTLGGGLGHLTRGCGLTIDNLLEADVVLADGQLRDRQRQEERGSVLGASRRRRQLRRRDVVPVPRAPDPHRLRRTDAVASRAKRAEVMKWYRQFITKAPKELTGFFMFLTVPPGPPFPEHLHMKKMCGVVWCYSGPLGKRRGDLQADSRVQKAALDLVGPIPHPAWSTACSMRSTRRDSTGIGRRTS